MTLGSCGRLWQPVLYERAAAPTVYRFAEIVFGTRSESVPMSKITPNVISASAVKTHLSVLSKKKSAVD